MPCVCLANTFARWKSLKAQKIVARKATQVPAMSSAPKIAAGAKILADGVVVKVSHPHKRFTELTPTGPAAPQAPTAQTVSTVSAKKSPDKKSRKRLGRNILKITRNSKRSVTKTAKEATPPAAQSLLKASDLASSVRDAKSINGAIKSTSGVAQPIFTRKPSRKLRGLQNRRAVKTAETMQSDVMPQINLDRPAVRLTRADLINAESQLGSTIFGPIPAGHRREFFHDRNNIWIWHEDWQDGQNNPHQMTVRYEVRTSGIYKKVSSGKYLKLEGDELENFRKATHAYLYVIKKNLYNQAKLRSTY